MGASLFPLVYRMLSHTGIMATIAGAVAVIDFTSQVTLGSLIATAAVIVIAGIFTIKSKIANIWREEAEGERAAKERMEKELAEEKLDRTEFEQHQQELRHELKDEAASLRAQLKAMEAKTDLTAALEAIKQMNEASVKAISQTIADAFIAKSKQEHEETHRLLREISDKLPSEPIEISIHDMPPETN